jgi:hypothetical protein
VEGYLTTGFSSNKKYLHFFSNSSESDEHGQTKPGIYCPDTQLLCARGFLKWIFVPVPCIYVRISMLLIIFKTRHRLCVTIKFCFNDKHTTYTLPHINDQVKYEQQNCKSFLSRFEFTFPSTGTGRPELLSENCTVLS